MCRNSKGRRKEKRPKRNRRNEWKIKKHTHNNIGEKSPGRALHAKICLIYLYVFSSLLWTDKEIDERLFVYFYFNKQFIECMQINNNNITNETMRGVELVWRACKWIYVKCQHSAYSEKTHTTAQAFEKKWTNNWDERWLFFCNIGSNYLAHVFRLPCFDFCCSVIYYGC